MADIKNQLVKDTYNYVLQSDLSTGYVYRIGGDVPVNPIFSSGLTILENFKYSNGTEQNGYVLYSDSVGNAYWGAPPSGSGGTASGDYLPLSGGTVTGATNFTGGLSANTISATTYFNLPSLTGAYLPLSGGTVTGGTVFTSGVTANTISQTLYIDFTTGTTNPSINGGRVFFNKDEQSLSYYSYLNNPVVVNTGQQLYLRVFNNTLSAITKGSVVTIISQSNGLPAITLAVNSTTGTTGLVAGLAAETIQPGTSGLTITNGILSELNISSAYTPGDTIYLDYLIPGNFSNAVPTFPLSARTNEIGYIIQTGTTTGKVYVNINNENIQLSLTDLQRNVLEGNVISTGIFAFSGLSLVSASGTTFNVAPVQAWIVEDTSNYLKPTVQYIVYSGASNVPATNVNTATQTYVLLTSGGTILQQTTFPSPQQRRENVYLGKLGHANKTFLINAFNEPDFDVSPLSQVRDMFTPIRLINGGIYPSANGANLTFNTSSGILYGLGIGWTTNTLNPDSLSVSGTNPCTFQYRTQTGGTASNTTLITPGVYDNNGVVTAVGGGSNSSTNQRIYLVQNGQFRLQYGQQVYGNLAAAIEASQNETFTTFSNFRDNAILIGILSVNKNATNLSDTTKAKFLLTSKFGETVGAAGGISTTNLQQAYNNSATPEIVTNSAEGALSIQNGTGNADNVTNLFEGKNTAGSTTSVIRADGAFSGTSIFGAGLTATTISATTYQNLPTDIRVTGGTYSNGTATFTNNTGGTFLVSGFLTGATFNGGTVTGDTIFTNNVTATTISATTVLGDNLTRTLYRLPSTVACPANTTTTAFTLNIPRASVFSGQTLKVEGIITAQQPTAANKTITCIWGTNTATPQNVPMTTTLNAGSFGFLARVTQTGVYYGRQSIYSYSNQSATAAADVGSNITVRIEVNPSTSAATVDHIVVTIY
jgi:hypothetical protein